MASIASASFFIFVSPYVGSEPKSDGKLQPAGLVGGHRLTKKRGTQVAHIPRVVHAIEHIEGVERRRDGRPFLLLRLHEKEVPRPSQIQNGVAGPLQTVPRETGGPVVRQTIAIVVASGRDAVWHAAIQRKSHSKIHP